MFGTRRKDDVVSADNKLLSGIRQTYKDEVQNIEISGKFSASLGKNPELTLTDGKNTVTVTSDAVCEAALKVPLSEEKCRAQLCKTGGTAYKINDLIICLDNNISLPLSALNNMRRDALGCLDKKRAVVHNYKINAADLSQRFKPFGKRSNAVRARVAGTKLSPEFKCCELVFAPLFSDIRELARLKSEGYRVGVEIPRGMFGRENQIEAQLEKVRELGITHALCNNIGALYTAKQLGFTLHGGFGLNLVNTLDLLWAEEYGLEDVELSYELTFDRVNRLGGNIPRGIISYGYLPLMLCRSCPVKSEGTDCKSCKNRSVMTDRKGKSFFLKCDGVCTEVLNCVPLYVDKKELSTLSTSFHTLRFTVENYVETVKSIADFNPKSMLKDKITHGLYIRGVE
jgi:putative protease